MPHDSTYTKYLGRDRKQKGGPKGVETNVLTLLQSFGHKKMRAFKRVVHN